MKGKQYTLSDQLTFGKYRGMTIQEVMQKDADYIEWCKKNIGEFVVIEAPIRGRTIEVSFYSKDVDILSYNPWGRRFFKNARNVAEDVQIVIKEKTRRRCKAQQLDIEFIS